MTIEKQYVSGKIAVRVSIQSLSVDTHSKMQNLLPGDIQGLKDRCDIISLRIEDLVGHIENRP